jgi:hypothetical protein
MRRSFMPVGVEVVAWIIGLAIFAAWLDKNHYWESGLWVVALVALIIWRASR